MLSDASTDRSLACPNCRAINPPNTAVCRSCGVHLSAYQEAQRRRVALKRDSVADHAAQLDTSTSATIVSGVARNRRQLSLQLRVLFGAAAILLVVIVIAVALYAQSQKQRRERLALQYQSAIACVHRNDYLCARDGFAALLQEEPTYPEVARQLRDARYELAHQYLRAGQWQPALEQLNLLLRDDPTDEPTLALTKDLYDRWYQDAVGRGDWITAFGVDLQRKARFPAQK
jgi:tetratricopeptide (TPR) repeat protein